VTALTDSKISPYELQLSYSSAYYTFSRNVSVENGTSERSDCCIVYLQLGQKKIKLKYQKMIQSVHKAVSQTPCITGI